jgi:outer membrane lipoprotein-sorting protein
MQRIISRAAHLVAFGAAVVSMTLSSGRQSAALAYTDLAEPFLNAKTCTFTITARVDGKDRPMGKASISGSVARMEMSQDGMTQINIMDAAKHTSLTLDPQTRQATLIRSVNLPPGDEPPGMIDQLKQIGNLFASSSGQQGVKREPLGEQQIDGRKLVGYRVAAGSETMELWADPKTLAPYFIVERMTESPGYEQRWSDFKFDVKLDPSLFSTDPPAGYKVNGQQIDVAPKTETDLINALQAYAKIADGTFPDTLDAEITITTFARSFAPDSKTHYAGKGVRFGAKDRPIFWYKPQGAQTYRVIFADLSTKEFAAPPKLPAAVALGNSKSQSK